MNEFGFSIHMDFLWQMLAFGLLAFAVVGMSLDSMMKKMKAPQSARSSVVGLLALAIFVPIIVFIIYTPFSGVKVGSDHIEIQYVWPRFSERISYGDLGSVGVDNQVHPTKMSSLGTSTLVLSTKNHGLLRSFDMLKSQPGPSPAEQAELAIKRARENAYRNSE